MAGVVVVEEEFITSGNWRGKHNSLAAIEDESRGSLAPKPREAIALFF